MRLLWYIVASLIIIMAWTMLCAWPDVAEGASSSHVLVGMSPLSPFVITACGPVLHGESDRLGIIGFVLDCPPGPWTVRVRRAEGVTCRILVEQRR